MYLTAFLLTCKDLKNFAGFFTEYFYIIRVPSLREWQNSHRNNNPHKTTTIRFILVKFALLIFFRIRCTERIITANYAPQISIKK